MLQRMALPLLLLGSGLCSLSLTPAARAGSTPAQSGAVPAMYATQAEAEAAAPKFGCKGAHKMGKQWMPCPEHPAGGSSSHPSAGH